VALLRRRDADDYDEEALRLLQAKYYPAALEARHLCELAAEKPAGGANAWESVACMRGDTESAADLLRLADDRADTATRERVSAPVRSAQRPADAGHRPTARHRPRGLS
jgi:hypothetical protein